MIRKRTLQQEWDTFTPISDPMLQGRKVSTSSIVKVDEFVIESVYGFTGIHSLTVSARLYNQRYHVVSCS